MKILSLLTECLLFAIGVATSLRSSADYATFSDHQAPPRWQPIGEPDKEAHEVCLRIGIKHGAFEELERHLYEVNDPDHHRYGKHLSRIDTQQFTTPTIEAMAAVQSWLVNHRVNLSEVEYSPSGDWVMVVLPLGKVESLLDTKYHTYVDRDGTRLVRTESYRVPKDLHQYIDVIQPTNYFGGLGHFGRISAQISTQGESHGPRYSPHMELSEQHSQDVRSACSGANVTISCLRTLYRTRDYIPQVPNKNSIGTTNWLGESAKHSDLRLWLQKFRPDADPDYTFTYQVVANGTTDQSIAYSHTYEANIDIQAVAGFVYPTRLTTYSTGGTPPWQHSSQPGIPLPKKNTNEPYLTFLDWLLRKPNEEIPHIISTSYGEDESTVPANYAQRVCKEFAILSARGITLLFGSGDVGVGANKTCGSSDRFRAYFPASCPYVTAVGGTSGQIPEVVGSDETGTVVGGGFSEYFERPKYQVDVVNQYLETIGRLHAAKYNRLGRAYPDIAAQSVRFSMIDGGESEIATGTSVGVQIAAGVIVNVNDALLAAGRPPLGFLNPWLYKYGSEAGFNDITIGNLTGCNTTGFPATGGWDVASGWGTPDFKNIVGGLLGGD